MTECDETCDAAEDHSANIVTECDENCDAEKDLKMTSKEMCEGFHGKADESDACDALKLDDGVKDDELLITETSDAEDLNPQIDVAVVHTEPNGDTNLDDNSNQKSVTEHSSDAKLDFYRAKIQADANGSEKENVTRSPPSDVVKNGHEAKAKSDVLSDATKVVTASLSDAHRHRCAFCDFQTSFRGKLSTHLISQHSELRGRRF